MTATTAQLTDLTLDITRETRVRASIDDTFQALLEELGPFNRGMADAPMPMVLEAHPGGRWYRDLGDGNGHCWGMVQAIRRPQLLEITGPLMMSFAVACPSASPVRPCRLSTTWRERLIEGDVSNARDTRLT